MTLIPCFTSRLSSIFCTGLKYNFNQPFSYFTFNAPYWLASTNPLVFKTGYQYSVQVSAAPGSNPRCLNGVKVLLSAVWLNNLPDCISEYCPSVSVSNFSHIIPCCERPHIQIFLPALSL